MLAGLGVKDVTIVARSSLLKFVDTQVVEVLEKEIERSGVKLLKGSGHTKVEKNGDSLVVSLDNGTKLQCQSVLSAIGRPPNTRDLDL